MLVTVFQRIVYRLGLVVRRRLLPCLVDDLLDSYGRLAKILAEDQNVGCHHAEDGIERAKTPDILIGRCA